MIGIFMVMTSLGNLVWLNPLWAWAALAAVGVPVLAHLLSRVGGRLALYPAVRFLQQAVIEGSRRVRVNHWLLLLIRIATLGLIVAAFARPVWYTTASGAAGPGITAVILLDRTASMSRVHQGSTLFDQARQQATQLLSTLDPARDLAVVISLDASPRPLLPQASANFTRLTELIEQLEPTVQATDLSVALELGLGLAQSVTDADQRTIHVELVSDLQRTLWQGATATETFGGAADGVNWRVHGVGESQPNVALRRARILPVQPVRGQPANVEVELFNHSDEATEVTVTLRTQGVRTHTNVQLAANATAQTTLTFEPGEIGWHLATLHVTGSASDVFELDDETGLFYLVQAARTVAVVTAADPGDTDSAAFFVTRALSPASVEDQSVGVTLHVVAPDDAQTLWTQSPRDLPFCVVVEADRLSDEAIKAMADYLRRGGGVLWIADGAGSVEALRQFSQLDPERSLSPLVPVAESAFTRDAALQLGYAAFNDPLLQVFQGPSRSALMQTRFSAAMRSQITSDAVVLLRFDDDTPALAAQWVAAGRLAVLAADISPVSSDLVKQPSFVPLLHELIRHLTPGPLPAPATHPGQPAQIMLSQRVEDEIRVDDPKGQTLAVTRSTMHDSTRVDLPRLLLLGAHALRTNDGTLVGGAYVELDAAESDLRREQQVESASHGETATASSNTSANMTTLVLRERGVVIWPWLVVAALAMVVTEMLVLHLSPRSSGGER